MFPKAYIFTEVYEESLFNRLSESTITRSVKISNHKTSSNTDADVLRMSAICNHYFGDNFKNLLIVSSAKKSVATYASILQTKGLHTLFVESIEDYELSRVLHLKLIEVNSYNAYIKATKQFYKLLNINKTKSYIPDLLTQDSELHAQKQSNTKSAEIQITELIKSRYIDSMIN
jgi:hypothetical protein